MGFGMVTYGCFQVLPLALVAARAGGRYAMGAKPIFAMNIATSPDVGTG